MLMQPPDPAAAAEATLGRPHPRLREIPYNYTSFSDREIVIRPSRFSPRPSPYPRSMLSS